MARNTSRTIQRRRTKGCSKFLFNTKSNNPCLKYLIVTVLALTPLIPSAFATGPGAQCYETYSGNLCGLLSGNFTQVMSAVRQPLESQIPGFSLVIIWGGLIGIIWFKTENIMLMSIVGLVVAATITVGGSNGISQQAVQIGYLLVGISIGILLFQLIRQRITLFS